MNDLHIDTRARQEDFPSGSSSPQEHRQANDVDLSVKLAQHLEFTHKCFVTTAVSLSWTQTKVQKLVYKKN